MSKFATFFRAFLVVGWLAPCVDMARAENIDMGPFNGSAAGRIFSTVVDEVGNTKSRTEIWHWNMPEIRNAKFELSIKCPDPWGMDATLEYIARYGDIIRLALHRGPSGFELKIDSPPIDVFKNARIVISPRHPNVREEIYQLSGSVVGDGIPTSSGSTPTDPTAGGSTTEIGIDRAGADYQKLIDAGDAQACKARCDADARCRAYTWVMAGVQSSASVCYLKDGVPSATVNSHCVSGTKGPTPTDTISTPENRGLPVEEGIDRAGSDYQRNVTNLDASDCRKACEADVRCKAYTWVKPGVQATTAVCYLKNSIPPAIPSPCCVSGVPVGR